MKSLSTESEREPEVAPGESLDPRIGRDTLLADYFRLPAGLPLWRLEDPEGPPGFFRFAGDVVCYGRMSGRTSPSADGYLSEALPTIDPDKRLCLPFDPSEVADNLRYERYLPAGRRWMDKDWVRRAYYRLRPTLPVSIRRHLQRAYLQDWKTLSFPRWPVDGSIESFLKSLLALVMKAERIDRVPFIWFWPDGFRAAAVMTHDVETAAGRDFCAELLDIDGAFGIPASFQIVPETRYEVPAEYLSMLRERGAEINVQGLDHAGGLFWDRTAFLAAAEKINRYAGEYGARGFRSPVLYRNVEWMRELDFDYDMSVPNVAHLEAQRGGCCTVMPYFLPGGMLELPLTTIEDYTLFHVLSDYSIGVWTRQMEQILEANGLMSFIIHPDYVREPRARRVFESLLQELTRRRADDGVWIARPGEVDRWWRDRSRMELARGATGWSATGPGSERARIAYASVDGDTVSYELG